MAWWWCITTFGSIPALTRKDGAWLTGETPRIKDLSLRSCSGSISAAPIPPATMPGTIRCSMPMDGARIPSLEEVVALASCRPFLLSGGTEIRPADPDSADPVALADAAL